MKTLEENEYVVEAPDFRIVSKRTIYTISNDGIVKATPDTFAKTEEGARFERYQDTIIDHHQKLIWQDVQHGTMDFKDISSILDGDWRIPTLRELIGIVDYDAANPAIDSIFSVCDSYYYWSSQFAAKDDTLTWCVDFNSGAVLLKPTDATCCIRPVKNFK